MDSVGQKLVKHWKKFGLPLAPGCPEDKLATFEKRTGVVLPADMRTYFTVVDGMRSEWPGDHDPQGFSFWGLGRLSWLPEEFAEKSPQGVGFPGFEDFYAFADYLNWSWAYAIRLLAISERNQVILVGKDTPELVAESFSEFVDLYLVDSPSLYQAPPLTQ